jgi:hypothetical protein
VTLPFALDRGERQLWAGSPGRGVRLRGGDAYAIPFTLVWAAFAVNWELQVVHNGAPLFFRLWGLPFLGIGVYLTVGRFVLDASRRARTTYVVTSERILIIRGTSNVETKSIPLASLTDMSLTEHRDGSGTVTFGGIAPPANRPRVLWTGASMIPAFEFIPDARQVYDIIRGAQSTAQRVNR